MQITAPNPSDLFSDARSPAELAERFEAYKSALTHAPRALTGGQAVAAITKSLSSEQLASLSGEMAALGVLTGEIGKDFTQPATGSNVDLTPYDLQGPAMMLVPRETPFRNMLPREKGQGTAAEFRRVLGWTNSSTGGMPDVLPFVDSQVDTDTFGSLTLRRGPKISMSSDKKLVAYVEMSASTLVTWRDQYVSQGYQDIRSLAQTALLWSHFTGEEKALVYARGASAKGYAGAVSAPVITVASSGTGGAVAAGTYYIKATARGGVGESVPSAEIATSALTGSTSQFTVTVATEPTGATGYNWYIGTASNGETYVGSTAGNTLTVLTTPATGGAAVPSVDTTVSAKGFDGFLTVLSDPAQSGYVKRVNAPIFNPASPSTSLGDGPWQDAFAGLYGANAGPGQTKLLARPNEVWVDGNIRRKLGDFVKLSGNANAYRIALTEGDATGGMTIGTVVSAIQNQTVGDMVDLNVHPYMPQGASIIRSRTLPIPDSGVTNTSAIREVQGYQAMDWPVNQFTYDSSTYWLGTLVHYAPMFSGALLGLS